MKTVILTGDFHVGSKTTNISFIKEVARKYWRGHPVALVGDLGDTGLDRGMEFSNKIQPQAQIDRIREITASLNIRAWCVGNHDKRIFKKTGLNPFIQMFGQEPKHILEIGGRKIYLSHGKSAAENIFLEHTKISRWMRADVIALGHSHALGTVPVLVDGKLCHYVRTGSFLGNEDYAAEADFQPLLNGWCEYDTEENRVYTKAIYRGEILTL